MDTGILSWGGYVPRLRLDRKAAVDANSWANGALAGRASGSRAFCNWDEDTLTMGERSLVRDGEVELVLAMRKAFQRTMGPELIAAVERESGRKVVAFLSDNRADPDVAVESFVLVPRAEGAPGGDDSGD